MMALIARMIQMGVGVSMLHIAPFKTHLTLCGAHCADWPLLEEEEEAGKEEATEHHYQCHARHHQGSSVNSTITICHTTAGITTTTTTLDTEFGMYDV